MRGTTRQLGAALAICAALVVTMAVTEAGALTCDVTKVRVTTRTLNRNGDQIDNDSIAIYFSIDDMVGNWNENNFYLDNSGIDDFKQGAIDEFVQTFSTPYPVYPTVFKRLRIKNNKSPADTWGFAGFKVDIWCNGATNWYSIYSNRGVIDELGQSEDYSTEVGVAGTDAYSGDHEVFWLINVGDHDADGEANDLVTCNDDITHFDAECSVRARVEDSGNTELLGNELVNSWWDVGSTTFVNPLERQYGEGYEETVFVDNFWRWFYMSGSFTHGDVDHAKLVLSNCSGDVQPCSMQTDYLHATVMQAWGKQTYDPYPYFRAHIYEGDRAYLGNNGWLEVNAGSASVQTWYERYYGFGGAHWHVESWQDSEHPKQQMGPACGYMSADMILSTRGFNYEEISTDDPYADAERWEEAAAIAHLEWGYKTMCCGSWNCCDDVENCVSDIDLDTDTDRDVCSSANYTSWWRWDRCDYNYPDTDTVTSNDKMCVASDRYFWRDGTDPDTEYGTDNDTSGERFPYLINYNGEIVWTCRPGVDDDGDSDIDETDHSEFWSDHTPEDTDTTDTDIPTPTKGIRGATNNTVARFLTILDTSGNSEWENYKDTDCGFNPLTDHYWGTISVTDALSYGYGMYFAWNHRVGLCGGWDTDTTDTDTVILGSAGGAHYSVIDGYEKIYHPLTGGAAYWDYLYFVADPNSPVKSPGTDHTYESVDNIGFTKEDFENTVKSVTIWNYDYFL
jgi:hypothetical protein